MHSTRLLPMLYMALWNRTFFTNVLNAHHTHQISRFFELLAPLRSRYARSIRQSVKSLRALFTGDCTLHPYCKCLAMYQIIRSQADSASKERHHISSPVNGVNQYSDWQTRSRRWITGPADSLRAARLRLLVIRATVAPRQPARQPASE
jgi:hypothetical protein